MSTLSRRHAMGAGGSSEWTPALLAPSIWLDDSTDITVSSGVSQWNDKSGNNLHFAQSDSTKRPTLLSAELNGRRALRFDGFQSPSTAGDKLAGPEGTRELLNSVNTAWCFAVLKKRTLDGAIFRGVLTALGDDANWRFGAWVGDGSTTGGHNRAVMVVRRANADALAYARGTTVLSGNWHAILWTQDYENAVGRVLVDGTAEFSASLGTPGSTQASSASQAFLLGGNAGFTMNADIDLACILFGSGSAMPSDVSFGNLFTWANARYAL